MKELWDFILVSWYTASQYDRVEEKACFIDFPWCLYTRQIHHKLSWELPYIPDKFLSLCAYTCKLL